MITASWKIGAALLAGLLISAALYTFGLDRVPAYLTLDEAHFSVHAASIADSGRNLNAQWLPPLISLEDPEGERFTLPWGSTYYLPFGMYLIAGVLQILPLDEVTVRLPSALLGGVVNVALVYLVAWTLFRSRVAAAASAAMLAVAPANVIISRQALDSVCQPPFVLGALWCLARYLRAPDRRIALLCGVVLGCGVYAYITSIAFMPFYLALFWFISWREGVFDRRAVVWSIAGFAAALLPMVLWLVVHPDAAHSLQMQYNRADPGSATLMQTIASRGAGAAVAETLRIYWSYFDPTFLFIQGGNTRTLSTGEFGVFLIPVALLAPIGLYSLRLNRAAVWILVIGLLVSPLPAVIKGAPYAIQRASGLLIYVSLFAGVGFAVVANAKQRAARAWAMALALITVMQFASFYRTYHSGYRIASARWYDPTAFREAAEAIFDASQGDTIATIYLPTNYYDVSAKWRFYTHSHQRPDLWQRTRYFADADALKDAAPDSLALLPQASPAILPEGWSMVTPVNSLTGEPTATLIRKH